MNASSRLFWPFAPLGFHAEHADPSLPPSRHLLISEVRALGELSAYFSLAPLLRMSPRGDGHPVVVIPGLAAGDASTKPLRAFLNDRGYRAHGWEQGKNHGPRPGVEQRLDEHVDALQQRYGLSVSLIGWSLGGVLAREAARRKPDVVRSVITLGSPFAGVPRASNAWRLFEKLSEQKVDEYPHRERMKQPPPVPATAIFSRTDGIVAWQGCLERESPTSENIEIDSSHCGLGHNPAALYAIADRLAQPEGEWRKFERSGLRALVYPDPYRSGLMSGVRPDVAASHRDEAAAA